MTAPTLYVSRFASPHHQYRHLGLWEWWITDGLTGPRVTGGTSWTERGTYRQIDEATRRCVCIAGDVRCDRPVLHPLTPMDAYRLTCRLALQDVPVTVRVDGPDGALGVVLWPAVALTTAQEVRALRAVLPVTDAPVRWAGTVS
jgi:hypothetical protein